MDADTVFPMSRRLLKALSLGTPSDRYSASRVTLLAWCKTTRSMSSIVKRLRSRTWRICGGTVASTNERTPEPSMWMFSSERTLPVRSALATDVSADLGIRHPPAGMMNIR